FEAEQRAMEDTEPAEVMAYISMLEKYIIRFRKEIEDKD
ncbi:MAG TPA: MarR family transcriptional regulator, partial [Lachnospiraceae bacterium]|nr:MarR family transcriptional regulator [Lachnospiraceae bacterium]